jgi:hypothetical protein
MYTTDAFILHSFKVPTVHDMIGKETCLQREHKSKKTRNIKPISTLKYYILTFCGYRIFTKRIYIINACTQLMHLFYLFKCL